MKKCLITTICMLAVAALGSNAPAEEARKGDKGEALFNKHCKVCHPKGGNIINPKKTLSKKDREAGGFKTAADIIKNMRNPGPGMNKFDEKTLPEKDAKEIAEYVLKTFK